MTKTNVVVIEAVVPPNEFWEDDLEMNLEYIISQIDRDGYLDDWIQKRTGRQIDMLHIAVDLDRDGSTRRKKEALQSCDEDSIIPFVLVERFSQYKSKVAVVDFAQSVLDDNIIQMCQKNEDDFDKTALLFAIYNRRWQDLGLVFHLDKIHKTGFARMKLQQRTRQPAQAFGGFLKQSTVKKVLGDFDRSSRDGLTSELKDVISHNGRHLVFIRRAQKPGRLVGRTGGMIHGYNPEWIILDFEDNAKRVNISSISVSVPLEIANRIASTYFKGNYEYDNENEIIYSKQIELFLNNARDVTDGEIILVEVVAANSPLDGAPKIKITDPCSGSIGKGIAHFEQSIGTFLTEIEHIESVKVLYKKKRVSLIFQKSENTDGEYEVRYSDHRLNELQRREFEKYMRDTHGITVLSTEKRFKKSE